MVVNMVLATNSYNMKINKSLLLILSFLFLFSLNPISNANSPNDLICTKSNIDGSTNESVICKNSKGDSFQKESLDKLLPAYRWDNFPVEGKFSKILKVFEVDALAQLSGAIYSFANVIWSVTLFFAKAGLSLDIITPLSPIINKGIATFSSNTILGPLVILAIIIILYNNILRPLFSRKRETVGLRNFTNMLAPLFIIAFIFYLGSQSYTAITNYNNTPEEKRNPELVANSKGTVTWMVLKATNAVSSFGSSISRTITGETNSFSLTDKISSTQINKQKSDPNDVLVCDNYNKALYNTYNNSIDGTVFNSSLKNLATLSSLWENSFYNSYKNTVFGTPIPGQVDIGGRVVCQYSETYNRVPLDERYALSNMAYPGAGIKKSSVLQTLQKDEDKLRQFLVFAFCKNINSNFLWNDTFAIENQDIVSANSDCKKAFSQSISFQHDLDAENFEIGNEVLYKNESANKFISNLKGDQPNKLVGAIIAFIVALVFLWTFGFISIGLILVNISSVILLTILPLILIALVIVNEEQKRKLYALLKLLGVAIATKLIFTIIIVLLLQITKIASEMLSVLPFTEGFIGNILTGFMPILALLTVKKILQAFSLGDIMKAGGALSLAWKAQNQALAGIDNKYGGSLVNKINNKTNKIPGIDKVSKKLDKLDRYGPKSSAKATLSKKYRVERTEKNQKEMKEIREERAKKRDKRDPDNFLSDKIKDKFNSYGVSFDSIGDGARAVSKKAKEAGKPILLGATAGAAAGSILPGVIGAAGIYAANSYNKSNYSDSENDSFDNSINKHKLGNNTKIQLQNREIKRKRLNAVKSGKDLKKFDQDLYNESLDNYVNKLYDDGFVGFSDKTQLDSTINSYAKQNGYISFDENGNEKTVDNSIIFSEKTGLMLPNPNNERSKLSKEQLKHWVYYLDKNTIDKKNGENDEQYINRLFSAALQRGLVSQDGDSFNPFEFYNLDEKSSEFNNLLNNIINTNSDMYRISSKNSALEKQIADALLTNYATKTITENFDFENIKNEVRDKVKSINMDFSSKRGRIEELGKNLINLKKEILETSSLENKELLEKELLAIKNTIRSDVSFIRKELSEQFLDLVRKQTDLSLIGEDVDYGAVKKFLEDECEKIIPSLEKIDLSLIEFTQGKIGHNVIIDDLTSIHDIIRVNAAKIIESVKSLSENKMNDINFDFSKIGDLEKTKKLIDLVETVGSEKFPIGKK